MKISLTKPLLDLLDVGEGLPEPDLEHPLASSRPETRRLNISKSPQAMTCFVKHQPRTVAKTFFGPMQVVSHQDLDTTDDKSGPFAPSNAQ